MRPTPWHLAEPYRIQKLFPVPPGQPGGYFEIPFSRTSAILRVVATSAAPGVDWEHVSVSLRKRTPNWFEMDFIKDIFWLETETVLQFHVPKSEHINCHPNCLHLWRPVKFAVPLPPPGMVGPKTL